MKVLVAEDDAISRTLLSRTLLRAGYEVAAVENGEEALTELMKEEAPRLALLDWVMPLKDGVEVCREIRRRNVANYTYLILVSSRESKEDIVARRADNLVEPWRDIGAFIDGIGALAAGGQLHRSDDVQH